MELYSNSINNPVNFYPKNTGNNIGVFSEGENHIYGSNIFSSEFQAKEAVKKVENNKKKSRKNKRLNTIDSDYFPDEAVQNPNNNQSANFFIYKEQKSFLNKIKSGINKFVISTPLINYFFLKKKEQKLQEKVKELNNIVQDADDLMNTAVPYGEDGKHYEDIAENLSSAANVLGKVNKEL